MSRDVLSNAQLLQVLAGVDGFDDRQLAGTPFPDQVPNYPALLSAAKTARALLTVGEKGTDAAPGATRKMRIGILKEGETFQAMDPRVARCVRDAVKKFEELGAEVVEVSVPGHTQVPVLGRAQRYERVASVFGFGVDCDSGSRRTRFWVATREYVKCI